MQRVDREIHSWKTEGVVDLPAYDIFPRRGCILPREMFVGWKKITEYHRATEV